MQDYVPSPGMNSAVRLPTELKTLILRYTFLGDQAAYLTYLGHGELERIPLESKREQLKRLRCMNRIFCDAVTPAVFASIHFHASDLSMKRAESIANSYLAGYVREIVHHEGSFANRDRDRQSFMSTLASHRHREDYPAHMKSVDRDTLYENFLEEIAAAESFPGGADSGFPGYPFHALFDKLPRCKTFVTLPYKDEWYDPETSAYTLRRTGLSYLPWPEDTPEALLKAFRPSVVSMFRPRVLNLSIFPCTALDDLAAPFLEVAGTELSEHGQRDLDERTGRYSKLNDLKLGTTFGRKYGLVVRYRAVRDNIGWDSNTAFLDHVSKNLIQLELTNDFGKSDRCPRLRYGFPKLECLTFSTGIPSEIWYEDAILWWIGMTDRTLKRLVFNGIILKTRASVGPWFGAFKLNASLVKLFYQISAITNLETCAGLRTCYDIKSNRDEEGRFVRAGIKPGFECLVSKIEDAVCHRRDWPFDLKNLGESEPDFVDISAAQAFAFSHWDDTVDEFELADERRLLIRNKQNA